MIVTLFFIMFSSFAGHFCFLDAFFRVSFSLDVPLYLLSKGSLFYRRFASCFPSIAFPSVHTTCHVASFRNIPQENCTVFA